MWEKIWTHKKTRLWHVAKSFRFSIWVFKYESVESSRISYRFYTSSLLCRHKFLMVSIHAKQALRSRKINILTKLIVIRTEICSKGDTQSAAFVISDLRGPPQTFSWWGRNIFQNRAPLKAFEVISFNVTGILPGSWIVDNYTIIDKFVIFVYLFTKTVQESN